MSIPPTTTPAPPSAPAMPPPLPDSLKIVPPVLPKTVPPNMIRLYCVGVYFYHDIPFTPGPNMKTDNPAIPAGTKLMPGAFVLAAAAKQFGLRYSLSLKTSHIEYISYTPTKNSPRRHTTSGNEFPYYGKELSLQEVQHAIGDISFIFQYTCDKPVATPLEQNPQFGVNGFQTGSEIRVRLLSIYDSAPLFN